MTVNLEQLEAEVEDNDRGIDEICGRIETLCARLDILGRRIQARMKHGEIEHGKRIKEIDDGSEI